MDDQIVIPLREDFRFVHGPADPARRDRFVGRRAEVDDFASRLLYSDGGAFLVTGYRGIGKTSFVAAAIARLRKLGAAGPDPVEVLDLHLSITRPSSGLELMYYVVRSLHAALRRAGLFWRLPRALREAIELAFLRTSASLQITGSRTEEAALAPALPVRADLRRSRAHQLTYSAYDDRAAEHDLIEIGRQLGRVRLRPRWGLGRGPALRTVVVFDELDKVREDDAVLRIAHDLKTLLTASSLTFVFVAGKRFHDFWREEVSHGDSVLESVFNHVRYVPVLWGCEQELIRGRFADGAAADGPCRDAVRTLLTYVGYVGRGVPRRVLRTLNGYVTWRDGRLALCVDRARLRRMAFFAQFQDHFQHREAEISEAVRAGAPVDVQDARRLGLYYLVDWIFEQGADAFTEAELLGRAGALSVGVQGDPELQTRLVSALLRVLLEAEYLETVTPSEATVLVDVTPEALEPRYRVPWRRRIEMGLEDEAVPGSPRRSRRTRGPSAGE